ncbi:MAG: amino acid ABC transporter permease [Hyphomicrobiales bacterium]
MSIATESRNSPKVSIWNDPKARAVLFQVIVVAVLLFLGYEIVSNTAANLRKLNSTFGFDFLSKTSGFDIIMSLIPYSSASSYGRALTVGFINTVLISLLSIITATIIGFLVGVMRLSHNWLISRLAAVYIEFFRNIPLLLQIFFWYMFVVIQTLPDPKQALNPFGVFFLSKKGFMMPRPIFGDGAWMALAGLVIASVASIVIGRWARARQAATGESFPIISTSLAMIVVLPLLGLALAGFPLTWEVPSRTVFSFSGGLAIIPEMMALYLALSIYTATYIAEAVRAGVQAVSHGQTEAAGALGLRRGMTLRLVVIPQALRVIIPPLASTYLSLTKNSSLAVGIGYPDLVAVGGTVLNQTGKAIEIVSIWMVVYLSLSLITSFFMNWFNSRMKLVER